MDAPPIFAPTAARRRLGSRLTSTTNDLVRAVGALGNELAAEDAAAFRLVVEGMTRELHPIVRDDIYPIAREALRNAFSHARAHNIEVEITYGRPGHFGLPGMRECATQIGAKLSIWSGGGSGTGIELNIPGSIAYRQSPSRSRLRLFK